MDPEYFKSIEKHMMETKNSNFTNIKPQRRIIRINAGEEIEKKYENSSILYLDELVDKTKSKYNEMTEKIKQQILTGKKKGVVNYQTLGWKQAKEIKNWCDENNIKSDIIEDTNIVRNKLKNIYIWHDIDGNIYDDGTDDYARQWMDFNKIKQNVVYIQVYKQ